MVRYGYSVIYKLARGLQQHWSLLQDETTSVKWPPPTRILCELKSHNSIIVSKWCVTVIIHVYTLMFVEIAVLWRTLKKSNKIKQVNLHNHEIKFRLLTLKPDIWKKTIHSQSFLKTKDSQVSFCKRTNKNQVFNYTVIENFKTICPYLTSGETALKLMICHWSVCKKTWKPFFFSGQSISNCLGWSVHTVNS